jgi:hypothetical protein
VPTDATQLVVDVGGSMFTRSFTVSFHAKRSAIDAWIARSPGTRDLRPSLSDDGKRVYEIEPGEGAQHATLTVDEIRNNVTIYTYWS